MKIKISSIEYDIVFRALKNRVGEVHPNQLKIFIDSRLPNQRRFQVVLHEVIHAIAEDRNLKFTENEVDNLAGGLCDFIESNKDVIDELRNRKA